MKTPNAPPSPYRLGQFQEWHKEGSLELAAPFQRKPVWSLKNKTFLIDTILNNLPMPEIFVQVKTDANGKTKYVVVDGQQRVRAILEFIEGEYALLEEDTSVQFAGKEFKDLPTGVKQDFWKYTIAARELMTDNEEEIKNIFRRLNKYVVPLNRQELRNATYGGHFIKMINTIAENDEFWSENKIMTPNEVKRMIDAEFISELFIGLMHGIQEKDQDAIDGFYKMHDQQFMNRESLRRDFEAVERLIKEILNEELVKTRWHGKVDFYSLFVAIASMSKEYYFPPERFKEMKNRLTSFIADVERGSQKSDRKQVKDDLVRDYIENSEKQTTHKATRERRYEIIRELLIPNLIAKDTTRDFTEEERRIAWNSPRDKKCAVCGKPVEHKDYQLDHKHPHSKGGKTELKNSQITHKKCNIKKTNKT